MQMLVRNRVKDFSTWHGYFKADSTAAAEYGLSVLNVWPTADDPNNVFFLLEVASVDKANAFMARPESQEIGEKSGVIDGEVHFLESV